MAVSILLLTIIQEKYFAVKQKQSNIKPFQSLFIAKTEFKRSTVDLPPLYLITPTWPRPVQIAELTRLGYLLKNVENLFWIVAEDSNEPTSQVVELLDVLGIPYKYLLSKFQMLARNI